MTVDIGTIITGLAAVGAMVSSILNRKKIKEIHVQINSRMDELLRMASQLGQAQGRAEEVTRAAEKVGDKAAAATKVAEQLVAKVEELKNGGMD